MPQLRPGAAGKNRKTVRTAREIQGEATRAAEAEAGALRLCAERHWTALGGRRQRPGMVPPE